MLILLFFSSNQCLCCVFTFKLCVAGIQEGTECTKCKNDWALRVAIALLYVLCTLLTIAVAVLGYKGGYGLIEICLFGLTVFLLPLTFGILLQTACFVSFEGPHV